MKFNLILLVSVMLMIPSIAFAQNTTSIIIATDKPTYTTGDVITLSGIISSLGTSNSAVLQVYNSFNVLVQIGTIHVAPDGTFSTKIKAEGQSWSNDGSYEIKVLYVSAPILATTSKNIDFKATSTSSQPPSSQPPTTPSSIPTNTPPSTTPSQTQSPTQQPSTSNTQNNSKTIPPPQNQDSVEELIKKRIDLANKLKQELNQNGNGLPTNSQKVPEFPFALPILIISILTVMIFYRVKCPF